MGIFIVGGRLPTSFNRSIVATVNFLPVFKLIFNF